MVTFYNEWMKNQIAKYKLWLEQGCKCIYTGHLINITNLFSDNKEVRITLKEYISNSTNDDIKLSFILLFLSILLSNARSI